MTRNLTMPFDEAAPAKLRVYAAQRNTTVNAISRRHAESLVGHDAKCREARDWMVAKTRETMARDAGRAATGDFDRGGEPSLWNREDTYAERPDRWPTRPGPAPSLPTKS